jgi:hypothetical protein
MDHWQRAKHFSLTASSFVDRAARDAEWNRS